MWDRLGSELGPDLGHRLEEGVGGIGGNDGEGALNSFCEYRAPSTRVLVRKVQGMGSSTHLSSFSATYLNNV